MTCLFLVALAFFTIDEFSSRKECSYNLRIIDHIFNCPGCIGEGKAQGIIDADGNFKRNDSNWLLKIISRRLSCPKSGIKYDIKYVAGFHPLCPTHGDLLKFYGYVPHQGILRAEFWSFAPAISFFGSILFSIITTVLFFIMRRRRKRDQNKA